MIFFLEGIDGSGKTFALNYLGEELRKRQIPVRLLTETSFVKGSGRLYDSFSKLFNLEIVDVKSLIYLARCISCYEDMYEFDKKYPETVTIKDRSWLTLLVYLVLDVGKRCVQDLVMFDSLVEMYMKKYPSPEKTFVFLYPFEKSNVDCRTEMRDYYKNFPDKLVYDRYVECISKFREHQNIRDFYTENSFEAFEKRNRLVLECILERLRFI